MKGFIRPAVLGSVAVATLLAGCAAEKGPTTAQAHPTSVPDITVLVDCGDCEVRPSVPELIRTSYTAAAVKAGIPIANDRHMTLTIRGYSERSLLMRSVSLLAGPAAMMLKDEIRAVALINGQQLPVAYHYSIPLFGIETAAQKLGELSFDAAAAH
ncbi:hypothetical protein [Ralstonia pseudosolanacearum]|uniref:hypothetical protein n=2 Tax=Ralstonia solanacearum species complex TaxID=3116862 RepID=UPI0026744683|nr:hypothetical protein [Ralstonia pseudosolanacearum]MDO3525007.1 hypothetical protein [Ralstonia pseudosolanacearum]MDO3549501.1 hypothetical protein [Ralstonia pseudosolanacearum]MDO3554755.1 hypothetical protein [Ralstonia pseudosolanacearum]MDO3569373.1 hypothetical protein [Ralstonia pseudosolanacearum]MDO3584174.1 hypothetical protein [Ralstonia pseudosolanacearum]